MLACLAGSLETVLCFHAAGADLSLTGTGAPGFHGKTAADLARARGLASLARDLARERGGAGGEG